MTAQERKALIEGILYVWGDPLPLADLSKILEISEKECFRILSEMKEEMDVSRRGLQIRFYGNSVQLTTRAEHAPYFERLFGEEKGKKLSHSALETLAIIAYKQPVTRVEVDAIRGVKSSGALDTLLERGLVEEAGRLDQIGRPFLYRTTTEFLRAFSLSSLDQLPSREEVETLWESEDAD